MIKRINGRIQSGQGRTLWALLEPYRSELGLLSEFREFPTRVTQTMQLFAHRGFARVFANPGPIRAPWQLKVASRIPGIHRLLGYAVGIGARPEHVHHQAETQTRRFRLAMAVPAAIGVISASAAVSWAAMKAWNRATHAQP